MLNRTDRDSIGVQPWVGSLEYYFFGLVDINNHSILLSRIFDIIEFLVDEKCHMFACSICLLVRYLL